MCTFDCASNATKFTSNSISTNFCYDIYMICKSDSTRSCSNHLLTIKKQPEQTPRKIFLTLNQRFLNFFSGASVSVGHCYSCLT